jgi:hypothetical protein
MSGEDALIRNGKITAEVSVSASTIQAEAVRLKSAIIFPSETFSACFSFIHLSCDSAIHLVFLWEIVAI